MKKWIMMEQEVSEHISGWTKNDTFSRDEDCVEDCSSPTSSSFYVERILLHYL